MKLQADSTHRLLSRSQSSRREFVKYAMTGVAGLPQVAHDGNDLGSKAKAFPPIDPSQPACIVWGIKDQTVLEGNGYLNFDTVELDTDQMFDVSRPDRITINHDGIYLVSAAVTWDWATTERWYEVFLLRNPNGSPPHYLNHFGYDTGPVSTKLPINQPYTRGQATSIVQLSAGDFVQALVCLLFSDPIVIFGQFPYHRRLQVVRISA